MKRKFIFFTLLLLTLIGGANWNVLNAQETITIGEDSQCAGFNILPNNCYYNYSITQQIYTSDELGGAPGVISTIAFRSSSTYNISRKFKVYMLNTSKGTFEDKTDMVNMTDENLVYDGDVAYVAGGEWMVLELSVPFNYTGENLILCVCDYSGTYKDSYNHFYVFDSGENRSLYKFTDNAAFDPSNIQGNNQQAASYQVGMDKKVNQIQFTFESTAPAEPSLTISAESIALGDVRMGNYWTEKPAVDTVEVKATSTTITSISCDNDFFTLDYDLSKKPVSLVVSYNKNASVSGEQNGNITITSADCEPVVIPVTATAYTPDNGDVYEKPITVNFDANNSFTAQATGMYDDYILPGEAEDGNLNDAVYKFELENDALITATVEGTNPIVAIYDEDFGEKEGPSLDNNNTGVQSGPSGPTTFGPYAFDTDEDMNYFTYDPSYWYYTSYSYRIYTTKADKWIFTKQIYALNKDSKLYFDYCTYNLLNKVVVGVMDGEGNITEIGDGYTSQQNGSTYGSGPVSLNKEGEYYIGFKLVGEDNYAYIDNIQLTDGSAKSRAVEPQIDGVLYTAGTYYLVAAAAGNFTLNLKKVDYIAIDAPQIEGGGSTLNKYVGETVTLEWSTVEGVDGYRVYNGEDELVAELENNTYEIELEYNVTPGYTFYVTAYIGENESPKSESICVKVSGNTTLSVTVEDANGNQIEGATIVLQGKDEFGIDRIYNNLENGTYTLEVLCGTYTATITKLDYNDVVVEEVTLSYAQQSDMDVVMQSKPSAPFTVNAEEGRASWDAEYTSYNVYRRDSESDVTSLATEVKANEYQDTKWETLADGEYEYGVSAMVNSPAELMREGFDSKLPNGWNNPGTYYQNGYNGYTYYWSFSSNDAYCYGSYTGYTVSLSTSVIDLSESSESSLKFDYKNYPYSSKYGNNTLYVKVKAEGESYWTTVQTISTNVQTYTLCEVTLKNYVGKKIQISFDCYTGQYAYTYIDNVVVTGTTKEESRINWSAPVEKGGITFTGDGNWNDEARWSAVPNTEDKVTIKGNATITENVTVGSIRIASGATLTVEEGVVLNVTNGISNTNAAALVMEDGAQIIQPNSNVAATFNMAIAKPTQGWGKNKDGWQFIASPLLNAKTSAFETSGENNDFDLYKYDGTKKGAEWVNYKNHKRVGDTFEHNFNDGTLCGWTNLDATYQWNNATGGINSTYCLTSANSGTSYIMSPKVLVEKGSKFYFTARTTNYDQNIVVAVSETGSIDDMATKLTVSIGTSSWQWQGERYVSLDEYDGKEIYIVIKTTSVYNGWSTMLIDNLRLTNAGGESDGTFETEFVNGRAYLASYQAETTATFTGVLNNATSFDYEVAYDAEKELANFHLLGNLFSFNMDWSKITVKNVYPAFATVNPSTGGYVNSIESGVTTIPVGDGFFVEATGENPSISYNARSKSRGEKVEYINVIASGKQGSNNVIIKLSGKEERGFSKLENLNQSIADIYVKNNGRQYSVLGYDNDVKEVELFFDAKEMGNYTIGIEPNGKFQSVTLVDRMTGAETNMLLDSYTFTATANDNPNRFLIRLDNGQSATDGNFVYQSGEELIVDAEGTIQIIDVMGRMVYSNDVESSNNRINVSNLKGATYIVRNISNNTVRTQKIVIL